MTLENTVSNSIVKRPKLENTWLNESFENLVKKGVNSLKEDQGLVLVVSTTMKDMGDVFDYLVNSGLNLGMDFDKGHQLLAILENKNYFQLKEKVENVNVECYFKRNNSYWKDIPSSFYLNSEVIPMSIERRLQYLNNLK